MTSVINIGSIFDFFIHFVHSFIIGIALGSASLGAGTIYPKPLMTVQPVCEHI